MNKGESLGALRKAVFLDRDGTINEEKNYLHRIEDFSFYSRGASGLLSVLIRPVFW